MGSFTPVTVAVCAVFQLLVVKVRFAGDTVPSLVLLLVNETTTSPVGWLFNTTVKLVEVPFSEVVKPAFGDTVIPAVGGGVESLSWLIAVTGGTTKPL